MQEQMPQRDCIVMAVLSYLTDAVLLSRGPAKLFQPNRWRPQTGSLVLLLRRSPICLGSAHRQSGDTFVCRAPAWG